MPQCVGISVDHRADVVAARSVNGFQGRFPPTFSSTRIFEQSFDGFRECIHVAVGIQQTVDAGAKRFDLGVVRRDVVARYYRQAVAERVINAQPDRLGVGKARRRQAPWRHCLFVIYRPCERRLGLDSEYRRLALGIFEAGTISDDREPQV